MMRHNVRNDDGKFIPYRCEQTVDLEEIITMQNEKFTHIKAEVVYSSGRTEEFSCKLNANNLPTKAFQQKLSDLESFPTVKEVKTERF